MRVGKGNKEGMQVGVISKKHRSGGGDEGGGGSSIQDNAGWDKMKTKRKKGKIKNKNKE